MKILKILLWIFSIFCLLAFFGVVLPWNIIQKIALFFGFENISEAPLTKYFFRISSLVYTLIGVFFGVLAKDPLKYRDMVLLGTYGILIFGVLCLIIGVVEELKPMWFLLDGFFCIVFGIGIYIFYRRLLKVR
jgi:hypothetical protein